MISGDERARKRENQKKRKQRKKEIKEMSNKKKTMVWMIGTAAISVGVTAMVAGGIAAIRNTKKMKLMRAAKTTGEVLCSIGNAVTSSVAKH